MKSMKKIADELNVTKMTVYNNAKKANIKFQKIDNVNYLSSEDEIIVVNRIKKNKKKIIDAESKTDEKNGSVAKLKLYAHLYKTIKANIVLTVKSFVSINYFSFFSINIT